MNLAIGFGAGLVVALVLGHFIGVLGWVIGLAAAFGIGTLLESRG